MEIAFYLIAAVAVLSALLAVSMRNLIYCGLFAALFFLSSAALFVLLKAEFIAVVQIIIYIGAVATLILFVIMLTQRVFGDTTYPGRKRHHGAGIILAAMVGFMLIGSLRAQINLGTLVGTHDAQVKELGKALLTTFVLPFEVTSLLLTVAMLGGIVIALEKNWKSK